MLTRKQIQEAKRRAKRDLLYFGKLIAPRLFRVPSPHIHKELAHLVMSGVERLCVQAPRGSAKTTLLGTLYPLHRLIFSNKPETIIIVSSTRQGAQQTLDSIKTLATSDYVKALFGDIGGPNTSKYWSDEAATFRNDMHIVRVRGMEQQIRGIHYRNQRPTLIILDDPDDEETAASPTQLEAHWRRLTKELLPAYDPERGRIIVIGTPVHDECIVERLSRSETWAFRRFKALLPNPEAQPDAPREEKYISYWQEWHPIERLIRDMNEAEKRGRLSEWWSEYMCELIGDEAAPFRESYLRYFNGELKWENGKHYIYMSLRDDETFSPPKRVRVNVMLGVDPAASKKATADFTGIVLLAMDSDENLYILEASQHKMHPIDAANLIIEKVKSLHLDRVVIETQGYQEMLRGYLRERLPNHIAVLGIKSPPTTRKEVRILSLQPEFAMRRYHLVPDLMDFKRQLLTFPKSAHDDMLDALYFARRVLFAPPEELDETYDKPKKRKKNEYNWMLL